MQHNTHLYHTQRATNGMASSHHGQALNLDFGEVLGHVVEPQPTGLHEDFIPTKTEHGYSPNSNSPWGVHSVGSATDQLSTASSKKRTRGNSGDQLSTEEENEKRKRKLQRNREIARQSRSRKREHTLALEEENARLREVNRRLELELKQHRSQIGMPTAGRSGRDEQEEIKRAADVKHIEQLTKVRASDADILNRLNYYKETYSDFGEERRSLVDVHLRQLKALMLPNQVSKMLMWLFMQEDSFYTSKQEGGMWNLLVKELGLSETQVEQVLAQRKLIAAQRQKLPRSLELMKELSGQLQEDFKARRQVMERFDKILTTTQEAKFLVWVENNSACVHMLNTMWMNVEGTSPDGAPLTMKDDKPAGQ